MAHRAGRTGGLRPGRRGRASETGGRHCALRCGSATSAAASARRDSEKPILGPFPREGGRIAYCGLSLPFSTPTRKGQTRRVQGVLQDNGRREPQNVVQDSHTASGPGGCATKPAGPGAAAKYMTDRDAPRAGRCRQAANARCAGRTVAGARTRAFVPAPRAKSAPCDSRLASCPVYSWVSVPRTAHQNIGS